MGSSWLSSACCAQRAGFDPASITIVKRSWTRVVSPGQKLHRDLVADPSRPNISIKFMHWNILADTHAHDSFPKVPHQYLKWEYRFELLKQHIARMDPDCLGLSEVDVLPLYKALADALAKMGYADYFVEKSSGRTGSAIFYKKDKFICLE